MNTTKEKVTKAFAELRKAGYFARQNFLCCQSCGWAAVPEGQEKVVFYHRQDNDSWDGSELARDLYLAWSGDAKEIVAYLVAAGLAVEHDGSEGSRIRVLQTVKGK